MAENNFSLQKTLTMLLDEKKYHSLRDAGNEYRWKRHDSLTVRGRRYF